MKLINYAFDNTIKLTEELLVYRGITDLKHINSSPYISTTFCITEAGKFSDGKYVICIA